MKRHTQPKKSKNAQSMIAEWMEHAWFTVTVGYPDVMDLLVSSAEIRAIEHMLRTKTKGEPSGKRDIQRLAGIRKEMAQSSRDYVWAFQQFADVMRLLEYRNGGWLKAYPHPQNLGEFAIDALCQRFPFSQAAQLDILIVHGDSVWTDRRYGPWPQPGRIVTEATWLINPRDWWRYTGYGFDQCLNLIVITQNSPFYRLDEGTCTQIWEDTLRLQRTSAANVRASKSFEEIEMAVRKPLGAMIQNLYSPE